MSPDTKARIDKLVKSHKIMVFMKGTKLMPQCGFSNNVVQILNVLGVPFETFDVLSDEEIRQGIFSMAHHSSGLCQWGIPRRLRHLDRALPKRRTSRKSRSGSSFLI
jgi:hypothetical protein